jgi:hypothetical protein
MPQDYITDANDSLININTTPEDQEIRSLLSNYVNNASNLSAPNRIAYLNYMRTNFNLTDQAISTIISELQTSGESSSNINRRNTIQNPSIVTPDSTGISPPDSTSISPIDSTGVSPILNLQPDSLINDGPWNIEYNARETTEVPPSNSSNAITSPNISTSSYDANAASRQQDLVNKGYDLGNYGPKKDGVDGDWGTKSKAAAEWDAKLRKQAATDWGISDDDLEWIPNPNPGEDQPGYGNSWGIYQPKHGTKSSYGDVYNSETNTFEDEHYAYDNEGNAITLEEYNKLYGEIEDNINTQKLSDKDKEENLKWYQKIGVNNITDLIEAASIMKTNKKAHERLNDLKKLKVKSKQLTPTGVSLSRVDYGAAKRDVSELGVTAVKKAMQEGKSIAEIQALKTGTAKELERIQVAESTANTEIKNKELTTNATLRAGAEEFNLTNDRKDQIANNEIQAAALQSSIALYNQMRDAISTKIKDAKLLRSAEKQMEVFAKAISGGTGLDERKLLPAIQYMLGNGYISQEQATTMTTDLQTLNKDTDKNE